jgi:hypothetical protein
VRRHHGPALHERPGAIAVHDELRAEATVGTEFAAVVRVATGTAAGWRSQGASVRKSERERARREEIYLRSEHRKGIT